MHKRKVESKRIIVEELIFSRGIDPLKQLVPVRKSAKSPDNRNVPVKDLVKGVERVVRLEHGHRLIPLLHTQMLIVEDLRVRQH